jgi:hypothetical protein
MVLDDRGTWVLYKDIAHLLVEEKFTAQNKQSTPCSCGKPASNHFCEDCLFAERVYASLTL